MSSKYIECVSCHTRPKSTKRRKLSGKANSKLRKYFSAKLHTTVNDSDYVCDNCRQCFYRQKQSKVQVHFDVQDVMGKDNETEPKISPKSITLPILSRGSSHKKCLLCLKKRYKQVVIPEKARTQVLIEKGIIIAEGSRCCKKHLRGKLLDKTILDEIEPTASDLNINRTGIIKIIESVRNVAKSSDSKRLDFDHDTSMTDDNYQVLTGLNRAQFNNMLTFLEESNTRTSKNRTKRTTLGLLLVKLKTGLSNRMLATLFGIHCRFAVQRSINVCRTALLTKFVPESLGFKHVSRDNVINNHTRPLAKQLFSGDRDSAIIVLDGTYIYIQKSGQYNFQRRSYSLHKNRPLVKPMMVCTTTGYIVGVFGPYYADYKNNDAAITKHIFENNIDDIKTWLKEDDILVVDRGFRDCQELLHHLGLKTEMPHFLPKGKKQHTTLESNSSRFVTKIRWVIESVNGRIKQWKALDQVVPNSQIPWIGDNVRIVCAMCNRYRPSLVTNTSEDEAIALKMLALAQKQNALEIRVKSENLNQKKTVWKTLDASDTANDFPSLSESDIRSLTLGVYQIKQAKSYAYEHLDKEGDYSYSVSKISQGLIRAQLQSRHVSSKQYFVYIQYDDLSEGCNKIKEWYCQCRTGARTVGMCAHIASVIWYLGYGRHTDLKSRIDFGNYIDDAADIPETDSDDSEASSMSDNDS